MLLSRKADPCSLELLKSKKSGRSEGPAGPVEGSLTAALDRETLNHELLTL
jgi:hypothetical protein